MPAEGTDVDRPNPDTMATALVPEGVAADLHTVIVDPATIDPDGPAEITPVPDARDERIAELEARNQALEAMLADAASASDAIRSERPVELTVADRLAAVRLREQCEREYCQNHDKLVGLVATSSLPPTWRRVLESAVPALSATSCELAALSHPEVPVDLSSERLDAIVRDLGQFIAAAIWREFSD